MANKASKGERDFGSMARKLKWMIEKYEFFTVVLTYEENRINVKATERVVKGLKHNAAFLPDRAVSVSRVPPIPYH